MPEGAADPIVVAITGASSGIGAATALHLAARGARLALGARRTDRLDELTRQVADAGGEAVAIRTDVRQRADVAGLVSGAVDRFGRLDVLVASAGVGLTSPLDDLRVDDWDEMIDVNVRGVLHGIAAALPVFREQGRGQFVHILSTSGLKIVPDQAVYAGTKNAARAITEGLRQEAGPTVRVTAISPGFVHTDFAAGASDPAKRAELLARRDQIAIPPEAIARAVAFAIDQPADVDVNEIVVRPTAQA